MGTRLELMGMSGLTPPSPLGSIGSGDSAPLIFADPVGARKRDHADVASPTSDVLFSKHPRGLRSMR